MHSGKTDTILKALMALMVMALVFVVAEAMRERIVQAGDSAPNFRITADNGKVMTRSDFGGKLLVLNFWATWCPPCVQEMPSLDEMQQRFKDKGLVVLAVSVDRNEQSYKEFLRRLPVSFVTARDPEANISSEYGTYKYPETYIIDSKGKVVAKYINFQNWTSAEILQQLERLL
ncbi:MAG: TlpA disulfide reductase family protein [Bryobacteraceae bacterium]|nr:TlpA disulfide reductase family protein [Bryobacteraceae bacterium]